MVLRHFVSVDASEAAGMREDADADDDGLVTPEEAEGLRAQYLTLWESLVPALGKSVYLDGRPAASDPDYRQVNLTGLVGAVDSAEPIGFLTEDHGWFPLVHSEGPHTLIILAKNGFAHYEGTFVTLSLGPTLEQARVLGLADVAGDERGRVLTGRLAPQDQGFRMEMEFHATKAASPPDGGGSSSSCLFFCGGVTLFGFSLVEVAVVGSILGLGGGLLMRKRHRP